MTSDKQFLKQARNASKDNVVNIDKSIKKKQRFRKQRFERVVKVGQKTVKDPQGRTVDLKRASLDPDFKYVIISRKGFKPIGMSPRVALIIETRF